MAVVGGDAQQVDAGGKSPGVKLGTFAAYEAQTGHAVQLHGGDVAGASGGDNAAMHADGDGIGFGGDVIGGGGGGCGDGHVEVVVAAGCLEPDVGAEVAVGGGRIGQREGCPGDVGESGRYVDFDSYAVRPALWIDLNS